jgi:hypothetical protein
MTYANSCSAALLVPGAEDDVMMGKSAVAARLQICGIAVKRQDDVNDASDELKWRGDKMRQTAPLRLQRRIVINRIPFCL